MRFATPLIPAMLALHSKRFLAEVMFDSGDMATAQVCNSGTLTGLNHPFSKVWLSDSEHPLRTYRYTWELVEADLGSGPELAGVNNLHANALVAEAIETELIPDLRDYPTVRREIKYGANSRADFLLEGPKRPACYVDVRSVHLVRKPRLAEFPDLLAELGPKHLDDLASMATQGARAVQIYVIQIPSAEGFCVARDIDPVYAAALDRARELGVEVLAWRCRTSIDGISLVAPVPIVEGDAKPYGRP
jgi:sugar fermentation stimulation protein A